MNASVKFAISMAIFGSIGFFSAKTGLPSIELVFVRCICASVLLGLFWLLSNNRKNTNVVKKKEVYFALLCGFFLVINWVFFFRSFELMSVTVAVSIYHLAPVLVLIIGAVWFKEKISTTSVIAVLVCFVGTLLVGEVHKHFSWQDLLSTGLLWAFGAALFYALTTLTGKRIKTLNPILTTFIQTTLGIFMLLPLIQWDEFIGLNIENWLYILMTGIIHTGFVYYLFFSSLRDLQSQTIAVLVFIDPAVAIFMDIFITSYRPDYIQVIGILLTFAGLIYAQRKKDLGSKMEFNS